MDEMAFLVPEEGPVTTPSGPRQHVYQTSLLNDTARASLVAKYRGETGELSLL